MSKQIKFLETELDTTLFIRNTRNITLTESGTEFLIHAEKFLRDYENIMASMEKYSKERKNTINIGILPVISQYGLTTTIATFKNKYPDININIIEGERNDVLDMLNKSKIDFAFLRDFNLKEDFLNIYPLISDELVFITSKKHQFSGHKYVNLEDAKDEDFILLSSPSGMDTFCINHCVLAGFTPKTLYSINKIETILGLVSEDFGISLLMKRVIDSFNNKNISVTLLKKPITNSLSLIYRKDKDLSKNEKIFRDFIINSIK